MTPSSRILLAGLLVLVPASSWAGPGGTPNGTDTPGYYDTTTQRWLLKNENAATDGQPDLNFKWTVASSDQTALLPFSGDFNGNGTDGIGVYDPNASSGDNWYIRQTADQGNGQPDISFRWTVGNCDNCIPVGGDWNNAGASGVGLLDPANAVFYQINSAAAPANGQPDQIVQIGRCTVGNINDVSGDWDGSLGGAGMLNGDTTGCHDFNDGRWRVRNVNSSGMPDLVFRFPAPGAGDLAISGDWTGMGTTTTGFFATATQRWYQRNSNTNGGFENTFKYTVGGYNSTDFVELLGDWDGL